MILAHKENIFLSSLLLVLICWLDLTYCCSKSSDETSTSVPDETSTSVPVAETTDGKLLFCIFIVVYNYSTVFKFTTTTLYFNLFWYVSDYGSECNEGGGMGGGVVDGKLILN